ncbi:Helix-turn-helix [Sphingobacterium nematocida]|uniref:Helix-turn-helix n=1 Tax=Sphingobacterium nematocida TaxID=1513896 RepID=A0A1T5FIZ4_9SPHI|nr:helix-turn-helix transcriptional regulator [Sphingobacterium nematocida]SKB96115.1 Helix-turn-helix [Sphingobacterium nematocida]
MTEKNKNPKTKFEWEIVKLVRALRKSDTNKVSQRAIAACLGVSPGYIGQIETETSSSMYTYDQLNKVAILLNCSPKDFMPPSAIEY